MGYGMLWQPENSPHGRKGDVMTDWRSIPAESVDWEINPISKRGGGYVRMMCNKIFWSEGRHEMSCGAWKDLTLGDVADLGEKHWLRCNNIGPKVVLVIKWILDEAASGRCPFLAAKGTKAADAYEPTVRAVKAQGDRG